MPRVRSCALTFQAMRRRTANTSNLPPELAPEKRWWHLRESHTPEFLRFHLHTGIMQHALMYVGGFERNRRDLTSSSTSFSGSDGNPHNYPAWPDNTDGLRISF